jgi:gliding motility-associated-like protein
MKRLLLFLCILVSIKSVGQLTVTASASVGTLTSKLGGPGVTILHSMDSLVCSNPAAEGTFVSSSTLLSMDSGILLTTGKAANAAGSESGTTSYGWGTSGDAELATLAHTTTTYDACELIMYFVPQADTVRFYYQFGSEEYIHSTCGRYNDAFAFFIYGPGVTSAWPGDDMALVPGTTIPVEVNSINSGTPGTYSGCALSNCTSLGTGSPFTSYYIDNTSGTQLAYRGYTTLLPAIHAVTPCDTYRLKMAIVDAGNDIYDSGVFIEAGSLQTNVYHFNRSDSTGAAVAGYDHSLIKGCSSATLYIQGAQVLTTDQTIYLSYGGTAVAGTDYTSPGDSITMPAGDSVVALTVNGLASGAADGVKTLTVHLTSRYSCGSADSFVINLLDKPTMTVSHDTCVPAGASVTLSAIATAGLTYAWSPSSSLSCSTCSTTVATPSSATTYTVTATVPGSTCSITDSVRVGIGTIPDTLLTPDTTICAGESFTIRVAGSSTLGYSWTPSTGLSSSTIADPVASPTVTTTYTLNITGASTCTGLLQTVTVTVHNSSFSLAPAAPLCGAALADTLSVIGGGAAETYSWSPSSGLSSATGANPIATPSVTTTYTVTGSFAGGVCPYTDTVTVVVGSAHFAIVTPPDTVCYGKGTPVSIVSSTSDLVYSWSPSVGVSDPTSANPVISPSVTTVYSVAGSIAGAVGCSAIDSILITVANPDVKITPTQTVCKGQKVLLGIDSVFGGGALIYSWAPPTGLSNIDSAATIATPGSTTVYTLTTTVPGTFCTDVNTVAVNVYSIKVTAGGAQSACLGDTIMLHPHVYPSMDYVYSWSGPLGFDSTNLSPVVIMTEGAQGAYALTVQSPDGGCKATDSVHLSAITIPQPLNLATISVCQNKPADPLSVPGYNLIWFKTGDSTGSLQAPVPNTTQLGAQTFQAKLYENNCYSAEFPVNVEVVNCCDGTVSIPDAFTPNSDGLNDYFQIIRPANYAIDQFRIFDRWGNLLFSGSNENDKWDGTFNGTPVDMGVYFYMIVLNCTQTGGVQVQKKGDVTLIR